jgi:hypothetical protein
MRGVKEEFDGWSDGSFYIFCKQRKKRRVNYHIDSEREHIRHPFQCQCYFRGYIFGLAIPKDLR